MKRDRKCLTLPYGFLSDAHSLFFDSFKDRHQKSLPIFFFVRIEKSISISITIILLI